MIIDTTYDRDTDETVIKGTFGTKKIVKRVKGMLLILDKDFEINRAIWQIKEELKHGK